MRATTLLIAAVVLGAGCTGDRPAITPEAHGTGSTPAGKPICQASPGAPPEGFVQVRSREIRYSDHIGVREEYRDETGRLLVYLLGVTGEMGEGATMVEDVELSTGEPATLFGSDGTDAWSVVWADEPPCPQMAIVGNGFAREGFISALRESSVLPDHS